VIATDLHDGIHTLFMLWTETQAFLKIDFSANLNREGRISARRSTAGLYHFDALPAPAPGPSPILLAYTSAYRFKIN
jgi:hypothetical protein